MVHLELRVCLQVKRIPFIFFLCSANIELDIMSSKSKMNLVRIIPIDQKHFPHKPSLQEIQIFLTWRSRDIIADRLWHWGSICKFNHFCIWPFCYVTINMHIIFWLVGFSRKKRSRVNKVKNTDQLCLSQAKLPKIKTNRSFPKCNIYWSTHPISLSMYPKNDDTRRNGM